MITNLRKFKTHHDNQDFTSPPTEVFFFLVVLGEFDENTEKVRTGAKHDNKKKRNSKKETKRSSIFSFTLSQHLVLNVNKSPAVSFSNCALDQLYKKK